MRIVFFALLISPKVYALVLMCSLTEKEFPKILVNKSSSSLKLNSQKSCPLAILSVISELEARSPFQRIRFKDTQKCLLKVFPKASQELVLTSKGRNKKTFPHSIELIWKKNGKLSFCGKQYYSAQKIQELSVQKEF